MVKLFLVNLNTLLVEMKRFDLILSQITFNIYILYNTARLFHVKVVLKEIVNIYILYNTARLFYVKFVLKEVVIGRNEQGKCSEAEKCHDLIDHELIHQNWKYTERNFNLLLNESNKWLPSTCWLPKLLELILFRLFLTKNQ